MYYTKTVDYFIKLFPIGVIVNFETTISVKRKITLIFLYTLDTSLLTANCGAGYLPHQPIFQLFGQHLGDIHYLELIQTLQVKGLVTPDYPQPQMPMKRSESPVYPNFYMTWLETRHSNTLSSCLIICYNGLWNSGKHLLMFTSYHGLSVCISSKCLC